MILSDVLSRQKDDNSIPHEIIPISFNMKRVLQDRSYSIGSLEKYLEQTRSQGKSNGIRLPEVHDKDKGLDPNVQPEKTSNKTYDSKGQRSFTSKTKDRTRENRNKMQNKNPNY